MSDFVFNSLNATLLLAVVEALETGEHTRVRGWGFSLEAADELGNLTVKELLHLARPPGSCINVFRLGDVAALMNKMGYIKEEGRRALTLDALIKRHATAAMIRVIDPTIDYVEHAKKRACFGVKRHTGRPHNVTESERAEVEKIWNETHDITSLAQRILLICERLDMRADHCWSALRQLAELIPERAHDKVLSSLNLIRREVM